ncbi:hypothetical protein Godav_006794, partial [Gossypium davidsonii]|nr:hypothetical protein [Gossypium davidsonii]
METSLLLPLSFFSIGLTANPLVNFSGVVGNNSVTVGTDLSFDTA